MDHPTARHKSRPRLIGPADRRADPSLRGWLRRVRAAGYQPAPARPGPVSFLLDGDKVVADPARVVPALVPADPAAVTLGLVAPTHLDRGSVAAQRAWAAELLDRASEAVAAHPRLQLAVLVSMQWSDQAAADEAVGRLRQLVTGLPVRERIRVIGLSLPGPGKVRALNAAIALCEQAGLPGLGWCDDDVRLEPDCLRMLIGAFLADDCRGAVGATKIPHASRDRTSQLLYRAKAVAAPATSYPHGCCLMVGLDVLAGGIPDRYRCDDGYVCFRLLDPKLPDPLRFLRLVPAARCHYQVAGPAGESRRRIRRLLLNHHVFLTDWPVASARYYLRQVLFPGMWPVAGWEGRRGFRTGLLNAAIKWVYFGWFAAVGAELFGRGLVGRPLRHLAWAGYSTRAPSPPPAVSRPAGKAAGREIDR